MKLIKVNFLVKCEWAVSLTPELSVWFHLSCVSSVSFDFTCYCFLCMCVNTLACVSENFIYFVIIFVFLYTFPAESGNIKIFVEEKNVNVLLLWVPFPVCGQTFVNDKVVKSFVKGPAKERMTDLCFQNVW